MKGENVMEKTNVIKIELELSNSEEFKNQLKEIEEMVDNINDKFEEVVNKQKLLTENIQSGIK